MEGNNNFDGATLKDGFAGERKYLKGFLAKMKLIFLLYPERYQEDEAKVIYVISRFYGNAMNWAATLIDNQDPCLNNYDTFVEKLKAFYGDNDESFVANQMLRRIKQRNIGGASGYILEFNKYADVSTWNEQAKMDAFMEGLNDQVANRILEMFPGPRNLSSMQTIASRIDSRLATHRHLSNQSRNFSNNRRNNRSNIPKKNNYSKNNYHGPLSKEEKERRKKENLCLYCGSSKHKLNDCPKRKQKTQRILILLCQFLQQSLNLVTIKVNLINLLLNLNSPLNLQQTS